MKNALAPLGWPEVRTIVISRGRDLVRYTQGRTHGSWELHIDCYQKNPYRTKKTDWCTNLESRVWPTFCIKEVILIVVDSGRGHFWISLRSCAWELRGVN